MPRGPRVKGNSGYYHIMLRGNERKPVFNCNKDKKRFLEILHEKKQDRYLLHAFCLMDNHIHLMMSEANEDISTFMKRIIVSYVQYFNKKYKRVGHLFQDRFKSEVVEEDSYVLALARYIHRNPVKAGIVDEPTDYQWSSYNCYVDQNHPFAQVVSTELVLSLLSANRKTALLKFREYMNQESGETFVDIDEEPEIMGEDEARKVFAQLLEKYNCMDKDKKEAQLRMVELIKEFRKITNFSIRGIAAVTGINKDKINRMLNS